MKVRRDRCLREGLQGTRERPVPATANNAGNLKAYRCKRNCNSLAYANELGDASLREAKARGAPQH